MAFGDVNIQNTQATTGTAQPTPVATPVVPEVTTTVIDLELQKILQTLGLSIEQWNAMTPQEQANKRAEYTQIQQQATTEQTNMGVTGLHVEQTSTDSTPVANTEIGHEHAHEHEHEHSHGTIGNNTENDKASWLSWKLKSTKNKREYLKQQMINSGKFDEFTDEEINQKLDAYIEYKTKQNLLKKESAPKLTNLSDEEWQNLSSEEKAKLIETCWESLDRTKKEVIKNKTINDYALMITNGLTQEEFNNLSKSELRILAIEGNQKQLNFIEQRLNTLNAEHETSGHEHSETDNNGCVTENEILKLESYKNALNREQTSIIANQAKITTKDNNLHNTYCVIDEAMKLSGLDAESFDRLNAEQKEEILSSYIKKQTSGLSVEDKSTKTAEIILNITNDKDITEGNKLYLTDLALKITGENPTVIVKLLNDEQFINNFITQCQNVEELSPESYDALGNIILTTDRTINKNSDDIPEGTEKAEVVKATRNVEIILSLFASGNVLMASIDDPIKVEMAKKGTRRIYENGSATAIETTSSTINASTQPGADILFGESAHIKDDTLRQEIYNDGIRGRNAETQIARNNYFISANPTSKGTYDTVNTGISEGIFHNDAQVIVAETVSTNAKENLSEEESVQVHKDLYDAGAKGFDAENQDNLFEIIMNAGYTEVQEYAASNIYKLDESVRDWAEEFTKSLDIESVTNAIQTEPPVVEEQKTTADNSYNNYENNEIISTAEVNAVNNTIQEIKNTLIEESTGEIKLDLNKQEDRDKLVEFFEQHPIEMAKYIERAPLKNKEAMLVTLCKASKSAAVAFVKQNPSLGLIILSSSQIELGIQHDVAKAMLQKADKGSDIWRAASDFLGKFYKGETTLPETQKKSIAFKA